MSLSDPKFSKPYNPGVAKSTRFGDASVPYTPTASPLNQIRGVAAKGSTGAGVPRHVSNVAARISTASEGTTSAISVTYSRDPSDTSHSKVNVYVSGYQGNKTPVQVASGSESPVTFVLNNTGETLSIRVQSQGNSGAAPLDTAPTAGIQLAKSTAGGFGVQTTTSTPPTPPPTPPVFDAFWGPGIVSDSVILGGSGGTFVSLVGSADEVRVSMFSLTDDFTITKVSTSCSNNAIGRKASFGIYSLAGNLLLDSGQFLFATSPTVQTNTIAAVTLSAGVYFFAQTASDHPGDTFTGFQNNTDPSKFQAIANANLMRMGVAASVSSVGVLPATLGAITPALPGASNIGIALPLFEP